jgi:hypothetical protein
MKTVFTLVCFLLISSVSFSQRLTTPTLSPFSKISQQAGLTVIDLEYSRPSARGRTVFGNLVPYGKIWRTGANASTKISLKENVQIGGNPLDSGTYAIYTIPGAESWTIIIHSNIKMRSLAGDVYKQEKDVFRFEVKPEKIEDMVETFTFQFTDMTSSSVNLQLSWENTKVNIPILVEVDNKIAAQMEEFLKTPETIPHRTYFEAAQYYLHNDRDLDQALNWINDALVKSPENPRYGLLKAKIQDKAGDKKAAIKTVNLANDWAVKADNANYTEQTDIYRKSLVEGK